jgi:fructose-1-phosphate kinase PfkB-like protein
MKNKRILTVTPNPALDLGGVVEEIIPNEKNYVEQETRHPGKRKKCLCLS